jgi:hypothetical protein
MFYPNGIATIDQRTLAGITNIERYFWWQGIHGGDCFQTIKTIYETTSLSIIFDVE